MPIRLRDQSVYLGRAAASLDNFAPNFDGSFVGVGTFTGTLARQLQPFTGAMVGQYQSVSLKTGTIGVTLQNASAAIVGATADTVAPPAPSAPTIDAFTSTSITIRFPTSSAPDHASWNVWRSPEGNFWTQIATGITAATYTNSGLTASTTYYYALVDVDTSANASTLGASVSQATAETPSSGLPSYTPTHYVTVSGAGSHNGSLGNEWTLAEAMANAVAGNVVRVAPGIYVGPGNNGRWSAAFAPQNNGTSLNPIIFYATNRAGLTYQAGVTSEIRSGATSQNTGSPAFGTSGASYIHFDGFYTDHSASNNKSGSDTGPVTVNGGTGSKILSCVIKGENISRGDNFCGVRLEGCDSSVVSDCYITGFNLDGGSSSQNFAGVMTYDAENCVVERTELYSNGIGIFWKGDHSGDGQPQTGCITRHNIFRDNQWASLRFGGHTPAVRGEVYGNLFISSGVSANAGVLLTSYDASSPDNVWLVNNTFVEIDKSLVTQSTLNLDNYVRNNIFYNGNWPLGAYSTSDANTFINLFNTINNNLYYGYSQFTYTEGSGTLVGLSFAGWSGTYGQDTSGINGSNPNFVNEGAEDFSLQSGSPAINAGVDVLNLLGGGTSGSINIGAYYGSNTPGRRT